MSCTSPRRPDQYSPFKLFRRVLAVLLATTLITTAFAQAGATGTIRGRVMNAKNGLYLSAAVITVEGTNLTAQTDNYGNFSIIDVPAGDVKINATFAGQKPVALVVTVPPHDTANVDITFNGDSVQRNANGAIVLDPFTVAADRYKTAQEIAIQQERSSVTIKNVVAADAFGDIPDGNIGEFVKYIPGVQIDYGNNNTGLNAADNNATQVSVRGFGPEFTSITVDGVPLTNASPATLTRAIGLDMMSINNASRVEVIKVPTPDMPANSPGGSINLVTRSAFEFAKPQLSVAVSLNVNSEDTSDLFQKTPGPANKSTYKTLPGVDFSYVLPVRSNFGISVSGAWSKTFNENHRGISDYFYDTLDFLTNDIDLTPVGGKKLHREKDASGVYHATQPLVSLDGDQTLSVEDPLLWRFQAVDTPNVVTRSSAGVKFDWKPTPSQWLAVGYTYGRFESVDAQRRLQFNGKKGYVANWGPDFTEYLTYLPKGTIVNGKALTSNFDPGNTIAQTVTTLDRDGETHSGYLTYKFDKGPWQVSATISESRSEGGYSDEGNGHFSELETSLTLGRLNFRDIVEGIPGTIEIADTAGNALDWSDLSKWKAPSITAKSGQTRSIDERRMYRIDVRRDLDFIHWSDVNLAVKTGFYREEERTKKWGLGTGYRMTYYGPTLSLDQYMDESYSGITPGFGLPGQDWLSTYALYDLWRDNPSYFTPNSDSDQGSNWQSYVNQQKSIKETSNQYYLMIEGRALKGRLSWIVGARQEIATRKGYAPKKDNSWNYIKDADGSIYRNAANPNGIRIDQASSPVFAQNATGAALRSELSGKNLVFPDHTISSSSSGGTFLEYSKLAFIPFDPIDGRIVGKPTPSVSTAYEFTKNFIARLSWNRQQAKPDFENGTLTQGQSQNVQITEAATEGSIPAGTIKIANPDLKPWTADSFDLQLAYYTDSGGKLSVNPFFKMTKNFQEELITTSADANFDSTLSGLGLDRDYYQDYEVSTTVNGVGTSKTLGYELELSQNLGLFGDWGRHFNLFANYSHQYIKQNNTTLATAKPMSATTASAGLNMSLKGISVLARALFIQEKYMGSSSTYTTLDGQTVILGQFTPSEIKLDLNIGYQIPHSRYSLFLDARNVLNESRDTIKYDKTGVLPEYAKHIDRKMFGVTYYFGVKAIF
ncbi:MAG TPA: TonB-dependent receptor plug domain-containing protein [Opitutaceae bacterium]|nr:TonB-dependent receptor plug domain-containing protein [Opitutaceae bacterium]